jgi:hypothetical protein
MNKGLSYLRNILFLLGASLVLNIISWLIILAQIKPTSEILPLHYNVFYGADIIGKGYYLYLIPFAGLAILGVNYFLYRYAIRREPFVAKTLVTVALVVQIFVLIAVLFLKSIII